MAFLWFKVGHILGFVSWFAGIFYIWRLFVNHAENDSEQVRAQMLLMAFRLYRYIMRPAMIMTLVFGGLMLYLRWSAYSVAIWIWIKIGVVSAVLFLHFMADSIRRRLEKGERFTGKYFRIMNEVPTILLIAIVILAVLKDSLWS